MRKANNMDENKYNLKWLNIKWYIVKTKKWDPRYTYLISLYHGSEKKFWIIEEMFILKENVRSQKNMTHSGQHRCILIQLLICDNKGIIFGTIR